MLKKYVKLIISNILSDLLNKFRKLNCKGKEMVMALAVGMARLGLGVTVGVVMLRKVREELGIVS